MSAQAHLFIFAERRYHDDMQVLRSFFGAFLRHLGTLSTYHQTTYHFLVILISYDWARNYKLSLTIPIKFNLSYMP